MDALRQAVPFLFSRAHGPRGSLLPRWLFLRALGLIYLSAFLAFAFQAQGLLGAQGVLPAVRYLAALRELGFQRFFYAPTLLWLHASDASLTALAVVGLLASAAVVVNVAPRAALLVCWLAFLSFIAVAQDFGQYQSDGMLLEAGFLALFVSPAGLRPALGAHSPPVRAAVYLLLWEWFRIYFESGVVKLQSGDPTWRNLSAMYEYYQNGPLPTSVGWYLQHAPHWFHVATAGATLLMELVLVFLAFLPSRRARVVCFLIVTPWQAVVILTANYAFLNYLVLVLGFLLLDDESLRRVWRWPVSAAAADAQAARPVQTAVATLLLGSIAYATTAQLLLMFSRNLPLPTAPIALLEPFRVANSYGLFANMTPHRYEIEFQGSDDNATWTAYPFRFKPQAVNEAPGLYAPYQPRFDWNLWFASLAPYAQSPIVLATEERLLQGSPQVLSLFRGNPFPREPPHYVRAVLWQYWFTSLAEQRRTGAWWRRQLLGTFAPTLTLLPGGRFGAVADPELDGPPAP